MARLEDELKQSDCSMSPDDFQECIADTFARMFRGWTDEQLLCEPDAAKDFCRAMRRMVGAPKMPDNLICRTLINMRKQSHRMRESA